MIGNCKNVLVLAPYTDDGELGLGGTINKLITEGKRVTYVAFSTAEESVPPGFPKDILKTEVRNATAKLGIKSENLIIYSYQVRKLNYVRQEILEELIKIVSEKNMIWFLSLAYMTFIRIIRRLPKKVCGLLRIRRY